MYDSISQVATLLQLEEKRHGRSKIVLL